MSTPQEKAQCVSWFIATKSDIRLKFHCAWMSDLVSKPGNTVGFFLRSAHFRELYFRYQIQKYSD